MLMSVVQVHLPPPSQNQPLPVGFLSPSFLHSPLTPCVGAGFAHGATGAAGQGGTNWGALGAPSRFLCRPLPVSAKDGWRTALGNDAGFRPSFVAEHAPRRRPGQDWPPRLLLACSIPAVAFRIPNRAHPLTGDAARAREKFWQQFHTTRHIWI